jgi:hypothetical protein
MKESQLFLVFILLLFVTNIMLIVVFFFVIHNTTLKKEAQYKEEILKLKYQLLEQHYSNNFNFLHKLIHNCNEINNLMDNKKYDEADKMIKELTNISIKEYNSIYTNYAVLNNVINQYKNELTLYNIEIKSVILYNEFHRLSLQNQIDLFTTLLDLAINNCKTVMDDNRIIIIKTTSNSYQIIIQVIFSTHRETDNDITDAIKNLSIKIPYDISIKKIDNNKKDVLIYFSKV